jgi:hypothetical protein
VFTRIVSGAGTSSTFINRFVQTFYGQNTASHKGGYRYHGHGLMEDIAHIKFICGVIIIRGSDLERTLTFLKKYNAKIYTRDITLTPEDEKTLTKEDT